MYLGVCRFSSCLFGEKEQTTLFPNSKLTAVPNTSSYFIYFSLNSRLRKGVIFITQEKQPTKKKKSLYLKDFRNPQHHNGNRANAEDPGNTYKKKHLTKQVNDV